MEFETELERRRKPMTNWAIPSFPPFSFFGDDFPVRPSQSSLVSTRLDLVELPDSYRVNVELPGIKKEDIKIHVEGDVLYLEAESKASDERGDERFHYSERRFGRIKRQVALPSDADVKKVNASFENGILKVEMAKGAESAKRQMIDIQ